MAVSKFAVACVAAILAGGASAGLAGTEPGAAPAQVADAVLVTPIGMIDNADTTFRDVPVEFVSGKSFGHVVAVATNGQGRATRIRVALNDMPSEAIWLDRSDLVYSRSRDAIIAHDVHAPTLAVADAR